MYDPLKMAEAVARVVCRNDRRKYYRFRPARFYGGIATGDCVGCCLRCIFCWSWPAVTHPDTFGRFYAPAEVAEKLIGIARKKGFEQVRISGNEPTLCREHLIQVLELIPEDLLFILETNGILIGADESYARDLARFKNLYVRLSLKGATEEEFSLLTGAEPKGFSLQLAGVENLFLAGVQVQPAVMSSFSSPEHIRSLKKRLGRIHPDLAEVEIEELVLYGEVAERLEKAKLKYRTAYQPRRIPPEQV